MKRSYSIILTIIFVLCTTANAQWTQQHTFTGTEYLWLTEAVDENVCWGSVIYNSSLNIAGYIKTTDGGNTWQNDTLPNNWTEYSIHARNANVAYFGIIDLANVGRMIKTTDGGSTWFVQSTAYGSVGSWPNFIHFFDDDNGFTQGDPIAGYLEMYTTTNAGNNWIPVPTSNMPPTLTDEYAINTAVEAFGDIILIPVSKWNTNQFRIFKSTDRGFNWSISAQFTLTFPGGFLIPTSFAFKNELEGILIASDFYSSGMANSNFKILKTTDGGSTWPEISFPLSIDPLFISDIPGTSQGYVVTAPINNNGSAYSLDGGNNWQMIEDNLDLCIPKFVSPSTGWAMSFATTSVYKYTGLPIPAELTSFTATSNGKEVILNWSTATEINNQLFEVQRSFEGNDFATIGFVNGKGTTTERQNYSYSDKNLSDGKYSYRLKQIDYLGRYEYSDVIEVDYRGFNSYLLEQNYPNPFNPVTTIGYGIKEKSNVKITILNSIGEEVAVLVNEEKESGYHAVEFNAVALPSGVYFYQLRAGEYVNTKKMILLK